jgi:hypothetical protein|tara:strand:- start:395 stop:526 length:132 start_codon:yes stop_codon:yes gene_type:complete
MTKEKKQKVKKFSWKEHNKWISSFADVKTVYPEVKPTKRKRKK